MMSGGCCYSMSHGKLKSSAIRKDFFILKDLHNKIKYLGNKNYKIMGRTTVKKIKWCKYIKKKRSKTNVECIN